MWNQEKELNYIEIYQTEPILWEPTHKYHKDKRKVYDAWARISEETGFPIEDLKKKKNSLMATFRSIKREINTSLRSGSGAEDVEKPIWFAFDLMNSFLGHLYKCKETQNTENQTEDSAVENEKEGDQEDTRSPKFDQKKLTPTIRRRRDPPELRDAGKVVQDALATLKSTMNRKESQSDQDDVYELYGKMLAKKIKTLPEEDRLPFMYEIDGIFLRHQQNSRQRYNRSNSPTQSKSTMSGRPSTSHSVYSEHSLYNSPSPVTHNSDYNETTGSRVIETPDEMIDTPVIHISGYSTDTNSSRVIVTSNKIFKAAAIRIPNYRTNTNSGGTLTSDEELPVIHIPGYSGNNDSGAIMVTSNDGESPNTNDLANSGTEYEVTESGNIIRKAFNLA